MRRDTTGGIGIGEASRALKRIGKSIGKKMARLPEGRYAIVLSSMVVAGTQDRKSTRLNSSHVSESRMPSSA